MDNNIMVAEKRHIQLNEIWESQPPLMHGWLLVSSVGMIILYFAMNVSPF